MDRAQYGRAAGLQHTFLHLATREARYKRFDLMTGVRRRAPRAASRQ